MRATRQSILRMATLSVMVAPSLVVAQVQQGAAPNPNAGLLTPATTNAAAVTEMRASLDRYNLWSTQAAAQHAKRALELEPAFGLVRTIQAIVVGGPTQRAELVRAATEASTGSAVEALLALSAREVNAGRAPIARRLSQTASDLAPNDREVATWRALQLADTQRVNAFRDVARRFPDYAAPRIWLAFYLTPIGQDSIIKANATEALQTAMDAVRLAPNESGTHAVVAHVLVYNGRLDEAKAHLAAATKMAPVSEFAFELQAQVAAMERNFPALRAALDSAAANTPSVPNGFAYRRARALVALSEGNPELALSQLADVERDAESVGAKPAASITHLFMTMVAAAIRDTTAVEQHLAAARMLDSTQLGDYPVSARVVGGQPVKARLALEEYIRVAGPRPNLSASVNATRTTNVHRFTGLVLLAEKKPQEAIAELRQGGTNPYAALGIIEAYMLMKDTKQADAERAAFFQRKDFSYASTATPIIQYRAKK